MFDVEREEVKSLLELYYFNRKGTSEEFDKFADRMKSIIDRIDGGRAYWDLPTNQRMALCDGYGSNKPR